MTDPHDSVRLAPGREGAAPGPVMVIGGAEDKLGERVILARFVQLAGGPDAIIAVISTASTLGDAATELYRQILTRVGAREIRGLRPETREEANDPTVVETLRDVTGIFMTGGNQLRLSSVIGGTKLGAGILEAHGRGAVVAGTSAGASAAATHMMAFGSSGATPKHRMAHVSVGLGLLVNVVVDQHFEQRTRLGRLLAVVAQSPALIGLGLDEDTAAIVDANDVLEVIGRGSVTVVDGSDVITDAFNASGHKPMMVSNARLHSLPSGYRFDLRSRRVLPLDVSKNERIAAAAQGRIGKLARQIAAEGADSRAPERRRLREEDRKASE
ncbi:MAG: cyanophycinase [Candidatus Dormibacteraeota bacterium]|nr:cyanophycinase [Candidatus Dormibacteraeota bacterium]